MAPQLRTLDDYRQALAQGGIAVARCRACQSRQTMPSERCFECGSPQLEVHLHAGDGLVFAWVVSHYAFREELAGEVPYTVVLVTLEGGGRIHGRLEPGGVEPSADLPVRLDGPATAARGYPVFRRAVRGEPEGRAD